MIHDMPISSKNRDRAEQGRKAELLRSLQQKGRFLILPNAWDAASAKIFELVGFQAIATTSGGIAAAQGYPDGQVISPEEMLDVVSHISRAVSTPVTADMEAGYGNSPEQVFETTREMISAGAVGMNLEDTSRDGANLLLSQAQQVERIKAVKEAASSEGVNIVLNARTDVYLHKYGNAQVVFEEALERGRAYSEAGADSVFLIGLNELFVIEKLVREVGCPVNILVTTDSPSIQDLKRVGVVRVSFGSAFMRAALTNVRQNAQRLFDTGNFEFLNGNVISHQEMNSLLSVGTK